MRSAGTVVAGAAVEDLLRGATLQQLLFLAREFPRLNLLPLRLNNNIPPPAITGSSAFPPFPTRFDPLHGGVSSMFYFFSNGQFSIGYEYRFLVWTS